VWRPLLPRGVAEYDDEAGGGLHLELVEEVLAVLGVRTAVHVEQHRIALGLVEVDRPHDPGVDLVGPIGGGRGEVLPTEQRRCERVADVGAALVADVELGRVCRRLLGAGDQPEGGIERGHRHRPLGERCRRAAPVGDNPVEVRGAPVLGGGEQMLV
jgi:hypothetical protein